MGIGVGAETVVTGDAYTVDLRQGIVHAVGAVAIGPRIPAGCRAVRRVVVTGSAI